jgi:hypothetical protein
MKGRAGVIFPRKCRDGHFVVNLKVRVELDEMDIPDMDIFERLLSYRVVESLSN